MCAVELYWLPLGADGWVVKHCGRIYERFAAARARRAPRALFHSALIVRVDRESYAIELCPEARGNHGRVASGPVGSRLAGRLKIFRYEARCWAGGEIPDIAHEVGGAVVVSTDREVARTIVGFTREIPTPVWGKDELGTGEMWNSNSVIAWLLTRAGIDAAALRPPLDGRAPGWDAGVTVAQRAA